jgi:hypothetical protein
MKNNELYQLAQGLNAVKDLKGVQFAYAVLKNKKIVKDELDILSEAIKASPEFEEFDKKRVDIVKKFAEKDESGEAKVINQFVVTDNSALDAAITPLKEEYKKVIEKREKQIEEFNTLLESESTVVAFKIDQASIPNDISVEQLENIRWIVEE